jgi:dihydrolipoamide dehydrogenase
LAYFYNAIGTQVTLVEFLPDIVPLEDKEISSQLGRSLKKAKIKVMTNASVESVEINNNRCTAYITQKGKPVVEEAEIVLSAVGIVPNLENLGLEELGIIIEKGKIKVDDFYKTNIEGVYAIGDIVHGPALAHVASAEGIVCVEKIAGLDPHKVDYTCIPSAYYTTPEVASVGLTEEAALAKSYKLKIGKFNYKASGKAAAAGNQDGLVKLIFDADTDLILGAHACGLNVTEMIAELVVAKQKGLKGHDLMHSIHPHPTMSEAIMEAAADAYGEAIHV